jgi:hypothetical protein
MGEVARKSLGTAALDRKKKTIRDNSTLVNFTITYNTGNTNMTAAVRGAQELINVFHIQELNLYTSRVE